MEVAALFLTHAIANRENKSPFFFSHFTFQRMKERGNTHFCFHCGGNWGFKPGKGGVATNCEDDKITLSKNGTTILIKEALADKNLEPHIANTPGYPRRKPENGDYKEWLTYTAHLLYSELFVKWCEQNGYEVNRYNPMRKHNPQTHANAVVSGANKYEFASQWFEKIKLPKQFPYIVCLR